MIIPNNTSPDVVKPVDIIAISQKLVNSVENVDYVLIDPNELFELQAEQLVITA